MEVLGTNAQAANARVAAPDVQTLVHEIGNVLTPAKAYIERALPLASRDDRLVAFLQKSAAALDRLTELLNATCTTGSVPSSLSPSPASDVVNDAMALLAGAAGERQLILQCESSAERLASSVPDARLHQVLANLLLNAIRASNPDGTILVNIYTTSEDLLRIDVSNRGTPLPDEILSRINRGKLSESSSDLCGLGLRISASILAEFGGHLSARVVTNKTTTVSIITPIRYRQSAAA